MASNEEKIFKQNENQIRKLYSPIVHWKAKGDDESRHMTQFLLIEKKVIRNIFFSPLKNPFRRML